jgi:hypothetical protein
MVKPDHLKNARTFRIGTVPTELPQGAEHLPAFQRNGVTYISLSHLGRRLVEWTNDATLDRNAKSGISTLKVGSQTLQFSPNTPFGGSGLRPISLTKEGYSTLYVPLAPVAKELGLTFKLDPANRLFDLNRGTLLKK